MRSLRTTISSLATTAFSNQARRYYSAQFVFRFLPFSFLVAGCHCWFLLRCCRLLADCFCSRGYTVQRPHWSNTQKSIWPRHIARMYGLTAARPKSVLRRGSCAQLALARRRIATRSKLVFHHGYAIHWYVHVRFPWARNKMASGGCVKQELWDFTRICFTVEKPSFSITKSMIWWSNNV